MTNANNVEKYIAAMTAMTCINSNNSWTNKADPPLIEDVYRSLLALDPGGMDGCHGVEEALRANRNPRGPGVGPGVAPPNLGWIAITGCPGYGSNTIGQYISYVWALAPESSEAATLSAAGMQLSSYLNGRFVFVYRIQCRLLGRANIWDHVEEHTALGYMCELIFQSLGSGSTVLRKDIKASVESFATGAAAEDSSVLFIIDGFDEIRNLYGVATEATAVIDKMMSFKNGIVTAKKDSLPSSWMEEDRRRIADYYELLGLAEEEVFTFIRHHFSSTSTPSVANLMIEELRVNEEMLRMAMVPINCVALCVSWDTRSAGVMASATGGAGSLTMIVHRVAVWLTLRYSLLFKVSSSERKEHNAMTVPVARQMYRRCAEELYAISAVAFEAFKLDTVNLSQDSITDELLSRSFASEAMLRRLVATFGMLRAGTINYIDSESYPDETTAGQSYTYTTTTRFIHRSYYEYFVALYMVENMCATPSEGEGAAEEALRMEQVLGEIRDIIVQNPPRYRQIRRFVAGLLALPDYRSGADSFWGVCFNGNSLGTMSISTTIDDGSGSGSSGNSCGSNSCSSSSIAIGVHYSFGQLAEHIDTIQESVRTYAWLRYSHPSSTPYALSPTLAAVYGAYQGYALWRRVAASCVLKDYWDYDGADREVEAKQQAFERSEKMFYRVRKSLGLAVFPTLDLSQWLMQIPSFKSVATSCAARLLSGEMPAGRTAAAAALEHAGVRDADTVAALRAALADPDPGARLAMAETLTRLGRGDGRSLAVLGAALALGGPAEEALRLRAASALGAIDTLDDPAASKALRDALNNESWKVCCAAAEALGRTNSSDANVVAILGSALHEPEASTRLAAVETLGRIGARDGVTLALVREALQDPQWRVAAAAAETLALLGRGDAASLAVLHGCVRGDDAYMRSVACELLGRARARDQMSISLLHAALRDVEWAVRYAAAESLNSLMSSRQGKGKGGRGKGISTDTASDTDVEIAVNAVFRTAIKNPEWAIRYAAAEALGRSGAGDPASLCLLQEALGDSIKYVRLSAADAIGKIGCKDAKTLGLLRAMLGKDDYWNGRSAAAEALGRARVADMPTLCLQRAALRDDDLHVCRAAALALRHLSNGLSDELTIKALIDCTTVDMLKDFASDSSIDLDIVHAIHVALLRIPPANYMTFFNAHPDYIANDTAQRCLLLSVWSHCASMKLDMNIIHRHSTDASLSPSDAGDTHHTVTVDGRPMQLPSCPSAELKRLFVRLLELEAEFMNSLRGQYQESSDKTENAVPNNDAVEGGKDTVTLQNGTGASAQALGRMGDIVALIDELRKPISLAHTSSVASGERFATATAIAKSAEEKPL
jgi:HEAT repeat protein